jgi:arginine/lysine/histidine transporter system substrate-binding protein
MSYLRFLGIGAGTLLFAVWVGAGELRVCSDSTPPFYLQQEGKPAGIEYDILSLFAKHERFKLKIMPVERFDDLIPRLQREECDVIAAIMTRTEEREKFVDFSETYFPVRMVLVQQRGHGLSSDLKALAGKKVATIKGTTYETVLQQVGGINLVYGDTYAEVARMTALGEVDAFACDTTLSINLLKNHPSLEIVNVMSEREYYAFALRKGSEVKKELDEFLKSIKKDGRYKAILVKYMDKETVDLVLSPD